ncbi:MAG: ATP-dependent zinc protease [Magnetococcales bacterium]|nr:ATP-dependent zinc protease [Magnetococcales bacterium]
MTPTRKVRSPCVKAPQIIGWREWVALPEMGVARIKCKIDTGARTSALHALDPHLVERPEGFFVRFKLHPVQRKSKPEITCEAPLVDSRTVVSSGGHTEQRFVIRARVQLGERDCEVEITLTDRAPMGFRMLIGRTAVRGKFLVDPGCSFLLSRNVHAGATPPSPLDHAPLRELHANTEAEP